VIREALPHDSAELHVCGEARYVDDLAEPPGTLFGAVGLSTVTHAKLVSLDLEPVRRQLASQSASPASALRTRSSTSARLSQERHTSTSVLFVASISMRL